MQKSSPHILIVEDEPGIAELLRFTLAGAGFETSIATNAMQARQAVLARAPEAILLDWMLPDFSGMALLQEARYDKRYGADGRPAGKSGLKEEGAMPVAECARQTIAAIRARRRELPRAAEGGTPTSRPRAACGTGRARRERSAARA